METLQTMADRLGQMPGETTDKVNLLNDLARSTWTADAEKGRQYAIQAREMALKLKYDAGYANAVYSLGFYHVMKAEYEPAMEKANEALEIYRRLEDSLGEGFVISMLGSMYMDLGNYEEATRHLMQALDMAERHGHNNLKGWTLFGLGNLNYNLDDFRKALEYYQMSLKTWETDEGDNPGDAIGLPRAMNGIGKAYEALKDYDASLRYFEKSLELFRRLKNAYSESRALNDIGCVYRSQGRFKEACDYLNRALEMRRRLDARHAMITTLVDLGILHNIEACWEKALEVLNQALAMAVEHNVKPKLFRIHQTLAESYELAGDSEQALKHFKLFHEVRDAVRKDETDLRFKNLTSGFKIEKLQKESEINRLKNVVLKEKNDTLKDALAELRAMQEQLVMNEKLASLGNLAAGMAHEINNPIGAILASVDILRRCLENIEETVSSADSLDALRKNVTLEKSINILRENNVAVESAGRRIQKITQSLKQFAKLDGAKVQQVSLQAGIDDTLTLLQHEIRGRIDVVRDYGEVPQVLCFPDQINQAFMNILINAVHAIEGPGKIMITTRLKNDQVQIQIEDTGRGIPEASLKRIFDPGFTTKTGGVGTGLGLSTVYKIVQSHSGTVSVKSEVGTGTTVILGLPVNPQFKSSLLPQHQQQASAG